MDAFRHAGRLLPVLAVIAVGGIGRGNAAADTLVFQQGASGYTGTVDTWVAGGYPSNDNSAAMVVEWDGADNGGANYGLLRFDGIFGAGAGQIAASDEITSATLTYQVINPGGDASVNEVSVDWAPPSPVTYNNFGGDIGVQTDEYGALVGSAGGATGTRTLNVRSSIEAWAVSPVSNRGWVFRPTGGTDGVEFLSSENGSASQRPKLTVVINEGAPVAEVVRGPYLQMVTPTSIVVRWRTDEPTNSRVRFGTVAGSLTSEVDVATLTMEHEITVAGLSAATQYYYDVGTSTQTLGGGTVDHFFYTSPVHGTEQPVRVWAIGDFGTVDSGQFGVRDAYYTFNGSAYTDVWLMLGDNAYDNGTDSEYQAAVFNVYQDLLIQTAFWSTRGNHENSATTYYGLVTNPTAAQAGGLASFSEAYYSFDYANIHFICLDSDQTSRAAGGSMMTWLANDLADTNQKWIVAFWHHPPYTKGTHNSDSASDSTGRMQDMREIALPILEAGGVDLALWGHSHVYERSYLIDGAYGYGSSPNWVTPSFATLQANGNILDAGFGREDVDNVYEKEPLPHDGAVYIVMGSSGRLGSGSLNHPVHRVSLSHRGSVVLDVDGDRMDVTMVRDNDTISDYFTIIKQTALPPSVATDPQPGDVAISVPRNPALAWTAVALAESHDVYFGTNGTLGPADFRGNQAETIFSPGTLDAQKTYYWQVDEVNAVGTTPGSVWQFTTNSQLMLAFCGVASAITDGNSTSLTIAKPANTEEGDLLVAVLSKKGGGVVNTPAGWMVIDEGPSDGDRTRLGVFYKGAGPAEPADYTITWDTGDNLNACGAVHCYRGADLSNPVGGFLPAMGQSTTPTAPDLVTSHANALVLRVLSAKDADLSADPYPAGLVGRFATQSGGRVSGGSADAMQAVAGSTGPAAFSLDASKEWRAVTVALAPVSCTVGVGVGLDCNANLVLDFCETIASGDYDADGDVDALDHAHLDDCLAGPVLPPAPTQPACAPSCLAAFDADGNGYIDMADYAVFQRIYTGG